MLFFGNLPWEDKLEEEMIEIKKEWFNENTHKICDGLPFNFQSFITTIIDLFFDDEPNYFDLIMILLCKPSINEFSWNQYLIYHDLHKAAYLIRNKFGKTTCNQCQQKQTCNLQKRPT